ncbi:MAG: urate hydroxylase PuuD [Candidatus Symbiobacter sp.]|nr:urate hydroxylase PuuD [Candidatus Symbiobacter sp.]
MKNPLESLQWTFVIGVGLAVLLALLLNSDVLASPAYAEGILRFAHVWCGILWIGLLYYFNFVQIPNMPNIPAEQKPAISKVIAPAALFYFRWAAMGTIIIGILLALHSGWLLDAITLSNGRATIGLGMYLGTIMWFNVWFVIWPNQKRALGLVEASDDAKKKSARLAMIFSRTNTALSVPMLYGMIVGASHAGASL